MYTQRNGLIAHRGLRVFNFLTNSSKKIVTISCAELLDVAKSTDASRILLFLKKIKNNITNAVDKQGNTFLHLVAEHNTPAILKFVISKLGKDVSTLCRQVNCEGLTPLSHISRIRYDKRITENIAILIPHSLDFSIKPLSSLVDTKAILDSYPETIANPVLANNLKMACEAINVVRGYNLKSSSYPELNTATPDLKTAIQSQIDHLRYSSQNKKYSYHEWREYVIKNGAANCGEHQGLVAAYLMDRKKDKPIRFEFVSLTNGDHAWGLIGRKQYFKGVPSDIKDPDTWGDEAVLVDSWSGNACPATKKNLIGKLQGFYSLKFYGETKWGFNFLSTYNPNYHKLESQADLQLVSTCDSKCYFMTGGLYKRDPSTSVENEVKLFFEDVLSKTMKKEEKTTNNPPLVTALYNKRKPVSGGVSSQRTLVKEPRIFDYSFFNRRSTFNVGKLSAQTLMRQKK